MKIDKAWQQHEIDLIKEFLGKETIEQIANRLSRTKKSVTHKVHQLGLSKPRRVWTAEILEEFKLLYRTMENKQLAVHFNCSKQTIENLVKRLKLVNKKQLWTQEEDQFLVENYGLLSYSELGKKINKTAAGVDKRLRTLNISRKKKLETYPEMQVREYLESLNISFITKAKIFNPKATTKNHNYLEADFLINNLIIEVMGTYWHCCPESYPNGPIDNIQIKNVLRDQNKQEILIELGYEVLYIWEKDCKTAINISSILSSRISPLIK